MLFTEQIFIDATLEGVRVNYPEGLKELYKSIMALRTFSIINPKTHKVIEIPISVKKLNGVTVIDFGLLEDKIFINERPFTLLLEEVQEVCKIIYDGISMLMAAEGAQEYELSVILRTDEESVYLENT